MRLRIRFHTAVVVALIEFAIKDLSHVKDVNIQVCNDFDGHFHEIKDMIFKHISRLILKLKPEDIIMVKFQKPSLIDSAGKAFRNKESSKFNSLILDEERLIKIIKK